MRRHSLKNVLILSLATASVGCGETADSVSSPDSPSIERLDDERTATQTRDEMQIGSEGDSFAVVSSPLKHEEAPEVEEDVFNAHIKGNQALTFDLHRGVALESDNNLMTSSWSLRQAFALLYPGARGETQVALSEVLHFEENIEETLSATNLLNDELSARQRDADDERGLAPIRINTANAIWAQDGFKIFDDFLNLSRVHLDASVHLLDFISAPERSRLLINDWVSHKTEDRVNNLLPERSINSLTRLVLTNAVHFQAPWAFPFEEHLTSEQPFVTLAGEELDVPMMNQTKVFEVAERDGVQALTMPFRDGQLAMTLLMPTEGDLSQLEDELTPELWSKIRDDQERVKRRIFIPKFKFEFNIKLNSFLKDQGLEVLFNQPDFSGISDQALLVSQVLQKTFIEVAEEGAEAAAATAILIEDGAAPGPVAEPPQELRFDHAFLFAIHDIETGAILFMGRLSDPR